MAERYEGDYVVIKWTDGTGARFKGTLDEVREKLSSGDMVTLEDISGNQVLINPADVSRAQGFNTRDKRRR